MYGITGEDQHTELATCVENGQGVVEKSKEMIELIDEGKIELSYEAIRDLMSEIHETLSNCNDLDGDWLAIWNWGMQVADPIGLSIRASEVWLTHHKELK